MIDDRREDEGLNEFEPARDEPVLKMARPVDSPPPVSEVRREFSARRAVVEIVIAFAVLFVPSLIRFFIFGQIPGKPGRVVDPFLYRTVVINGLVVIVTLAGILYFDRHPWETVGLRFNNLRGEILAAGLTLAFIYALQAGIAYLCCFFWPHLADEAARQRAEVARIFPPISVVSLFFFTLFVGFYEELLFRGFLIVRLRRVVNSPTVALLVSSVIFGLAHFYQDPLAMFQIFTIALILGGLFLIRKSLISPILVHAGFDFLNLIVALHYMQTPVK